MTERAQAPLHTQLESLFVQLRESLGDLAPEPQLSRMREVVEGFFEQFQLVPKREYDTHMATLEQLTNTVAKLEARIADLESHAED